MIYFESIARVARLLAELGVPYTYRNIFDGAQLLFPWSMGDVACHHGTFGCEDGFVETYQFSFDSDDVSVMSPEEAAARIATEYFDTMEEG